MITGILLSLPPPASISRLRLKIWRITASLTKRLSGPPCSNRAARMCAKRATDRTHLEDLALHTHMILPKSHWPKKGAIGLSQGNGFRPIRPSRSSSKNRFLSVSRHAMHHHPGESALPASWHVRSLPPRNSPACSASWTCPATDVRRTRRPNGDSVSDAPKLPATKHRVQAMQRATRCKHFQPCFTPSQYEMTENDSAQPSCHSGKCTYIYIYMYTYYRCDESERTQLCWFAS